MASMNASQSDHTGAAELRTLLDRAAITQVVRDWGLALVHGVAVDVTCYGLFHDLFIRNAEG